MVVVFSDRNATWKWKMAVLNLKGNYYWRDPCFLLPWLWEDRISSQFSSIARKQTKCISRHAKRTSAITISVWGSIFVVGVMKQNIKKHQPGTSSTYLIYLYLCIPSINPFQTNRKHPWLLNCWLQHLHTFAKVRMVVTEPKALESQLFLSNNYRLRVCLLNWYTLED